MCTAESSAPRQRSKCPTSPTAGIPAKTLMTTTSPSRRNADHALSTASSGWGDRTTPGAVSSCRIGTSLHPAAEPGSPTLRARDGDAPMTPRFTFAVVGHNEAATLPTALEHAFEAAEPDDHVWFVDSASDDGSADVARAQGAAVVVAPLGKGRAMATAISRCDDDFICFMDADMLETEHNIARLLREGAVASDVDMLIGAFDEPDRRVSTTRAIYRPLTGALFPEVLDEDIVVPFSGFRVLRTGLSLGTIPDGYGVESYLNVHLTMSACRIASRSVGWFRGNLRDYQRSPVIATDVAATLLDLAEARGRLTA